MQAARRRRGRRRGRDRRVARAASATTVHEDDIARRRDVRQGDGRAVLAGRRHGHLAEPATSATSSPSASELIMDRRRGRRARRDGRLPTPSPAAEPHRPRPRHRRPVDAQSPAGAGVPRRSRRSDGGSVDAARPNTGGAGGPCQGDVAGGRPRRRSPAPDPMAGSCTPISTPCSARRRLRTRPQLHPSDPGISDMDEIEHGEGRSGCAATSPSGCRRAKRRIPHFTYVEEIDVTELERLRQQLNEAAPEPRTKLNVLPFAHACRRASPFDDHPEMNAALRRRGRCGRSPPRRPPRDRRTDRAGLMVPVVRHAGSLDLWASADAVIRLSASARSGKIKLDELTGSTITITSLGRAGRIVSTPVINCPRGRDHRRQQDRHPPRLRRRRAGASADDEPVVVVRSPDHRRLDAAQFVQRIRTLLETPALLWATSTAP